MNKSGQYNQYITTRISIYKINKYVHSLVIKKLKNYSKTGIDIKFLELNNSIYNAAHIHI